VDSDLSALEAVPLIDADEAFDEHPDEAGDMLGTVCTLFTLITY
jgi:hypothetical protein